VLCRGALEYARLAGRRPSVIHAHDWQGGLTPVYARAELRDDPIVGGVRTVLTIHNLAFHGLFDSREMPWIGLGADLYTPQYLEFWGRASTLKGGVTMSDVITTVSPTYAREIETPAFGAGLDGLLRSRADALTGILNGVDTIWSPENDALLPRQYGIADAPAGKADAKQVLQRRLALAEESNAPLFGAVTRLSPQKGLDLLLAALPEFIAEGGRLALLGSGDADLESGFAAAAADYPGQVGLVIGYDEALSHLIMAGADVILVPSRFEPCGLTQLYALRYGALPLVRRTGGLADTVVDANAVTLAEGSATGFVFDGETPEALLKAANRAVALYADRASWQRVMQQAMSCDFSWGAAARQYEELYIGLTTSAAAAQQRGLA